MPNEEPVKTQKELNVLIAEGIHRNALLAKKLAEHVVALEDQYADMAAVILDLEERLTATSQIAMEANLRNN